MRTQEQLARMHLHRYIKQHMKSQCEQTKTQESECTHIGKRIAVFEEQYGKQRPYR